MTDLEADEDIKSLGRERLLQILGDTDVNKRMKVTELRALCRTKFPSPRKKKEGGARVGNTRQERRTV